MRFDACTRCGAYLHNQDGCKRRAPKWSEPTPGGGTCGERHLTALHGGSPSGAGDGMSLACPSLVATALAQPPCTFTSTPVLLALTKVRAAEGNKEALLLGDKGSQVSLIRHDAAWRLGCGLGQPSVLHLQVVGDTYRPIRTRLYPVRLRDSRGEVRSLIAATVTRIFTASAPPNLQPVKKWFPKIQDSTLRRPSGHPGIDILVGICQRSGQTRGPEINPR